MMPIKAYNLLPSMEILTNGLGVFATRSNRGISSADVERCRELAERSMGLATALNLLHRLCRRGQVAQEPLAVAYPLRQVTLEKWLSLRRGTGPHPLAAGKTEPGIPGRDL
jgi:aspartate ammonia-lyase